MNDDKNRFNIAMWPKRDLMYKVNDYKMNLKTCIERMLVWKPTSKSHKRMNGKNTRGI